MIKSTSFCLLFLFYISSLSSQEILSVLYDFGTEQSFDKNVNSIITYSYKASNFDEDRIPDTTVFVKNDSVDLFLDSKLIETFPDANSKLSLSYDHTGKRLSKEVLELNADGLISKHTINYGETDSDHMMNSHRQYTFENKRIVSVVDKGKEIVLVGYKPNGLAESFQFDAGIAKMICNLEKNDIGYVYNFDFIPNTVGDENEEGLLATIADMVKNMPKSYVLYEKIKEGHKYTYVDENKETNEIIGKDIYIRNNEGLLIESIESKQFDSHKKYTYNSDGKLLEVHDITNGTTELNEYDSDGNCIKEYSDSMISEYIYDANMSVVEERLFTNYGKVSFNGLYVKKIEYKK